MLRHIEGVLFLFAGEHSNRFGSFVWQVPLFFWLFVFTALKNPNGNQWIFVFVLLYKRNFEKEVGGRSLLKLDGEKGDGDPVDQGGVKTFVGRVF